MKTIVSTQHTYVLSSHSGLNVFTPELSITPVDDDLHIIQIKLSANEPSVPPVYSLQFEHPISDIHAFWHPQADRNRGFKADWMRPLRTNAATSAPVVSLMNLNGRNRLTFAFSDALNTVQLMAGVHEETGMLHCSIDLFTEVTAPLSQYEAYVMIDTRDVPYYASLCDISTWWEGMLEYQPAMVPDEARQPMYSTWYSMHQDFTAEMIEEQCKLAKDLGMDAVIVDDGWQTDNTQRGYAYTGDWNVYEGKFPNMREHVKEVHRLGMKFLLWYSVPHVGKHSQIWDRFKHKLLKFNERHGAGTLDPRYPDVREYIISKYEEALRLWDLDGFKLDFIDQFYVQEEPSQSIEGKDIDSIPKAVDRLLSDCIYRLRQIKPDVMIEFRQPYIGPAMRKYGNMLRAGDCPNDSIHNRVRVLDLRLLSGNSAVHSDMIMWNYNEPVESAALQLINVLFSVPQISVLLDRIPPEHRRMLQFWKENRYILLDGELHPLNPELLFPVVMASKEHESVIVSYHDEFIKPDLVSPFKSLTIINGRLKQGLYIRVQEDLGSVSITIRNCMGDIINTVEKELSTGIHLLDIPPSGLAKIQQVENSGI